MSIAYVLVTGKPFDLGYGHGKAARQAILKNLDFYYDLWKYFSGVERGQIVEQACKFVTHIERFDPELLEEIRGVAEGAEVEFEHIVALNCRWELNYAYMPSNIKRNVMEGCTSYAFTPETTRDGHTYIGQHWDYKPAIRNQCILLHLKQSGKPDILMHTEAGIIGHKGCNSAGIGIFLNFIRSEADTFRLGVPNWIKVRGLLNSVSLPDCVRILMSFEGPNSANIIVAHRDGEAIDAECAPADTFFLHPVGGILTHTNHFQSPSLRIKDTGKGLLPDTVIRNHRVSRLFREKDGNLELETIKEVLKDHFGFPDSICRHGDPRLDPKEQWETLTSLIADLSTGELHYTTGPPCSNEYQTIGFE